MDTLTIILSIIAVGGLIFMIIGNMADRDKMSVAGLIGFVLGTLFLFVYKFLSFIATLQ